MTTVITKTIGPSGRDYASFTLAEADVANIGTSADLVANDEAIVFEADAGTYSEHVVFQSTLTTDATRQVTYKPAAGSEHGGVAGAGVRIQFGNLAVASNSVSIKEAFTALDGLEIDWTDVNSNGRTVDINLDARGVSISNCLIRYAGTGRAIYHFQASTYDLASYPVTITNCAVYAPSGDGAIFYNYGASDKAFTVTNCTFTCGTTSGKRAIQAFTNDAGYTTTLTLTNNLVLAGGSYITSTGGSGVVTVLGSNNFGGSTDPFPAALQASSQTWTFTTDTDESTSPSTGSQVVYDATTGALVNSPNNDAVGEGTSTSVPTTDINGEDRIRGTYADPGAFTTELVTFNRTIGATGRDYATFIAAEADVTNIATNGNLQQRNERIVFEADAGTYTGRVTLQSTLTTDATRNVTYKPAAGSEHGGDKSSGVIVYSTNQSFIVLDPHTVLDGLVTANTGPYCVNTAGTATGAQYRNCIFDGSQGTTFGVVFLTGGTVADPIVVENCVGYTVNVNNFYTRGVGDSNIRIVNCTAISSGTGLSLRLEGGASTSLDVEVVNMLSLASKSYAGTSNHTITGSNNFGESGANAFPVAIQGSPYPITPTADTYNPGAAGDYALYDSSSGKLIYSVHNDVVDQGIGPSANSDVPTVDIAGNPRSGATANPGAFEELYVIAPTVITKTIGSSGDYATFALAEAATSTIGTSADLVANNETIVFEVADETFTESATLYLSNPALVTDATRNVTYKAASGRPIYTYTGTGQGVSIYDPYTRWSGIDVLASSAGKAMQVRANTGYGADQAGTVIENATITAGTTAVDCGKFATGHSLGPLAEPITIRNVVTKSRVAVSQFISGSGHTTGAHCLVVNCTHLGGSSPNQAWNWSLVGGMPSASFKIINCANLAQDTSNDANITGGGVDITGSTNNIGNAAGSNSSLHFANIGGGIGAQYTPTTNTDPGVGDFAIYDAGTGQLINDSDNDVINLGIGPASNSDVPTTGIEGGTRSGATTNPGAFATLKSLAPAPIIPDAIDYGMPGGYSVASILFENSTTCYLNGVQKTVLYPGQDLSLPLFRSTSADANKDLVIVPNTLSNKQIILHNYSWGHAGLDTAKPLYEPMLSWFTVYGSAVEGDGIALTTPRYIGDMDRTTPLEVALPPGKSLALSFVSFPSTPPNTTLAAALTVTYEIVDAGGSSTFVNNILDN